MRRLNYTRASANIDKNGMYFSQYRPRATGAQNNSFRRARGKSLRRNSVDADENPSEPQELPSASMKS